MTAYIPTIHCAKCQKVVASAMRLSDGTNRHILVRCHGEEQRIGFSDTPSEQVTLWQEPSTPSQSSS